MSRSCFKAMSLEVTPSCDPLLVDWTSPGLCRLRIVAFNPVDWAGWGACGTCVGSLDPFWNGEFPNFVGGATNIYQMLANHSISGAQTFPGGLGVDVQLFGGLWGVEVYCFPVGLLWAGNNGSAITPIGTHVKTAGCTGPVTLDIEVYVP